MVFDKGVGLNFFFLPISFGEIIKEEISPAVIYDK